MSRGLCASAQSTTRSDRPLDRTNQSPARSNRLLGRTNLSPGRFNRLLGRIGLISVQRNRPDFHFRILPQCSHFLVIFMGSGVFQERGLEMFSMIFLIY
jgi:hypothetical protein